MKKLMVVAVLSALPIASAGASGLRMTVEQPHFTCEGHSSHFSRAAFLSDSPAPIQADASDLGTAPLPCCDGKIGCAQFLSTNTIIRQATEWRG